MAINVRRKGGRAERGVAKLIEAWTAKKFAKTPSSGGLQWGLANAKGDITCTTEGHYFPFCIEVKFHKDIRFDHMLLDLKGIDIFEWWDQCSRDAKLCKKIPMLLMRYNGMPKDVFFMAFESHYFTKVFPAYVFQRKLTINRPRTPAYRLTIVRSDEFFKARVYKEVKKATKTYLKTIYDER